MMVLESKPTSVSHHHHHHHHSHHNGGPGELPVSSTYAGSLGYAASYSNHIQRSLPNMSGPLSLEPPKIYPYHLLIITNYRLPPDVDRKNLERHLSDAEFETLFLCTRAEFYRMPQWRRNEIKKRARLF
uniref:Actin-binding LIM protein 3 n=1 Tax=Cacopsylla melanoneura TaxID=428564 RepID=A0A8D8XH20_9HEMI